MSVMLANYKGRETVQGVGTLAALVTAIAPSFNVALACVPFIEVHDCMRELGCGHMSGTPLWERDQKVA